MSSDNGSPPDIQLYSTVSGLGQSPTLAINEASNALIAEGRDIIKFGLGQSPFPVPDSVTQSLKKHAGEKDYLPVKGLPALCQAVAEFHRREHGLNFESEDILIGPGSKELLFLLQLVSDTELMIPRPGWVSYAPQAKIVGRPVSWIHTRSKDDWMLTPEFLEEALENSDGSRSLLLNYPSNPTGRTFDVQTLREFADLARKHKILLISDEIYADLHHKGEHRSVAEFYPEGTIVSAGLSKWCGAGGWRLGTFAFPSSLRWLLDAMAAVASETFTSTSAPIQHAAVTAFERGEEIQQYVDRSQRFLSALGNHIAGVFRKQKIHVPDPEGGFYLFIGFNSHRRALNKMGIKDSNELAARILQDTGVAMLPGVAFGCPADELVLRLSYVDFDGVRALEAVAEAGEGAEVSKDLLKKVSPRVIEGTNRIVNWLEALSKTHSSGYDTLQKVSIAS